VKLLRLAFAVVDNGSRQTSLTNDGCGDICYVSNILEVGSEVVISSVAKLSAEKLGLQSQSKIFAVS
jgi:hypothetical protein